MRLRGITNCSVPCLFSHPPKRGCGSSVTPNSELSPSSMNSCDFADGHVPAICVAALRVTFALLQLFGGSQSRCATASAGLIPRPTSRDRYRDVQDRHSPRAALLCAIRDGLCPADEVPGSMLFSLMALQMLKCDEHGNPTLTDLARGRSRKDERQAPLSGGVLRPPGRKISHLATGSDHGRIRRWPTVTVTHASHTMTTGRRSRSCRRPSALLT